MLIMLIIIIIIIIKTCNALDISTLLGVQGAVKQNKNKRKQTTTKCCDFSGYQNLIRTTTNSGFKPC